MPKARGRGRDVPAAQNRKREETKGNGVGQQFADMASGPGVAGAGGPALLMGDALFKVGVEDMVLNDVGGEDDLFVGLGGGPVSEDKIVGIVVGNWLEAADFFDGSLAHDHGGAEGKLHALEHIGDEDAGGHLDAHADGLELRPESMAGDAAVEAGDHADVGSASGVTTEAR